MPRTCEHGWDGTQEASVDENELSSCCGAHCSFHIDGAILYCKCCYAEISGGEYIEAILLGL